MKLNKLRFIVLTLSLVLVVALAGSVIAQDDEYKILRTGLHTVGGDVPTIDPALAEAVDSVQVINMIFPGLTMLNELTAEPEPGTATGWEVSEDGLTYTFTLMEDIYWVQYNPDTDAVEQVLDENGEPRTLTAQDYIYGVQRAMNPETASYYASVIAPFFIGAEEALAGEAAIEDIQITAVNDLTIEITSPLQAGFLPMIYGMWTGRAVPAWAIEEFGDQWIEPENIETYGPFALKEWAHDESITMIKNPFWAGTEFVPSPRIDEVEFIFLDYDVQLANYEAGDLDASMVPAGAMDRLQADPVLSQELSITADNCTYYYAFNVEKEPFTDVRVREAFARSIDRQSIIDNILKAGQQPALFFSRPDLFAAPDQNDFPEYGMAYDPDRAQAALQEYLDENGITVDDMPPITLMYNTSELHATIAAAVQQMWSDNLGIEVQLTNQEWAVYLETRKNDAPQVYRAAWCFDYPDTHNFLGDVFYSTSGQNDSNFANEEFDALIDQALVEQDAAVREELYAEAERILTTEVIGISPIYYYTAPQLTKPNVERTYSVTSNDRYEKWDIVPE